MSFSFYARLSEDLRLYHSPFLLLAADKYLSYFRILVSHLFCSVSNDNVAKVCRAIWQLTFDVILCPCDYF